MSCPFRSSKLPGNVIITSVSKLPGNVIITQLSHVQSAKPPGAAGDRPLLGDGPLHLAAPGPGHHRHLPGLGPQAAGQPCHQRLALTRPQVEPQGAQALLVREREALLKHF